MLATGGAYARGDPPGQGCHGAGGRRRTGGSPSPARDGPGPRHPRPNRDGRAARGSAAHRGPRRPVVDPAGGGRADPGRFEGRCEMTSACHDTATSTAVVPDRPQLVLAGNPNVGKTTLF